MIWGVAYFEVSCSVLKLKIVAVQYCRFPGMLQCHQKGYTFVHSRCAPKNSRFKELNPQSGQFVYMKGKRNCDGSNCVTEESAGFNGQQNTTQLHCQGHLDLHAPTLYTSQYERIRLTFPHASIYVVHMTIKQSTQQASPTKDTTMMMHSVSSTQ